MFFSQNILFVEGITEYIFFTNENLRKCIPELNNIEIVPIFGKFNYIFFSKLFNEISNDFELKYMFLLDKDENLMKEGVAQRDLHKNFWKICTGGRLDNSKDLILHDLRNHTSWFPYNLENFLGISENSYGMGKEFNVVNEVEDRVKKIGEEKLAELRNLIFMISE